MKYLRTLKSPLLGLGLAAALFSVTVSASAEEKAPKAYPLDTCVVSGEKLGEMGDPYVFTHDGQEIKLCCKSCLKKFEKDPDKYIKKLKKDQDSQASSAHEGHNH